MENPQTEKRTPSGIRLVTLSCLVIAVLAALILAGILRVLGSRALGTGRIFAGRIAVVFALAACIAHVVCIVCHNDFLLNLK